MSNDATVGESMWKIFAQAVDELEAEAEQHTPPSNKPTEMQETTQEKTLPPLKIKQAAAKPTGKKFRTIL